ncbi:hypothetical protein WN48_07991 [Eufriesea mexicana]|nr:hypothetical protein WN48_07991 [Eufriesea mexicana]
MVNKTSIVETLAIEMDVTKLEAMVGRKKGSMFETIVSDEVERRGEEIKYQRKRMEAENMRLQSDRNRIVVFNL